MKKVLCFLLVSLLVAGVAACAPSASTETQKAATSTANQPVASASTAQAPATSETTVQPGSATERVIKVGWTPPDITGVFKTATDYMEKSIAEAKKAGLNIELHTRSIESHVDAAAQVETVENFIQDKMDVIVISPSDVVALRPVLQEVNKAGIPLIVVNRLSYDEVDVQNFVGFDDFLASCVSAYSMLDALGGPGVTGEGQKVDAAPDVKLNLDWWKNLYKDVDKNSISGKIAIVGGIAGDYAANQRNDGFKSIIDQYPNVKILTIEPADWNRQKAITAAENIIQNNSDLDGIWASCGEMALGASIAAKNAGKTGLIIISNDGTQESIDAIKAGDLTAETWHGFPEWGWYGIKFAAMLALGEETPKQYDIGPRTEYKANADVFYPEPKLDPIDWQEIVKNAKK